MWADAKKEIVTSSPKNYPGKHAYRGGVAQRYDEDRIQEPIWGAEQTYVREWSSHLPAGAVVLDLPVGTGRFLPFYAEHGLRVHGIDISSDMVAEAHRRYPELAGRFDLLVGDAEHLALPDQSVDCVLCWRLAHLLPGQTLVRVLREFRRVSRGEIVFEVLAFLPAGRRSGVLQPLKRIMHPLWRRLRPRRADQPWSHIANFEHSEEEMRGIVADAGLEVRSLVAIGDSAGRPAVVFHLTRV